MTVGERIKKIRENLNISQTDLAKGVNISKQTLYKYETNVVTNIPYKYTNYLLSQSEYQKNNEKGMAM